MSRIIEYFRSSCIIYDNKSIAARGKFTDKYRNKVTFLREVKIVPNLRFAFSNEDEFENESRNDNTSNEPNNDVIWLQSNIEPWNVVQEKWTNTYEFRKHFFQTDVTVEDIFNNWPILQQNTAYTLIDEDFTKLFPDKENKLLLQWEKVICKLVNLRKQTLGHTDSLLANILSSKTINNDYRHYLMLSLLASLIPSKAHRFTRDKNISGV